MSASNGSDIPSRVLALLPKLYEHASAEQFACNALEVASQLVPGDWHGYNIISATDVQTVLAPSPEEMIRALPAFDRNVGEHPFLQVWKEYADVCPVLSDLVSVGDFHRTDLYNEFYRQFDMEDQLSLARVVGNDLLAITVSRPRRNFTDEDRLAFTLLRPHILCAHQNLIAAREETARAASSGTVDEPGALRQSTMHIDLSGGVSSMGPGASQMLAKYFPQGRKQPPGQLPKVLQQWLRSTAGPTGLAGLDAARYEPLVIPGAEGRLTVRLLRVAGERLMLTMTERQQPSDLQRRIGSLPPRAQPVLVLLRLGLSEKEVAVNLQLSIHTVHEYVKLIYKRFGVSSRAELMTVALRPYSQI